ncbi:unnamed protein product [Strongylus vulgaris]|uniref:5-formyltetrahydrofolate cyclo-ligase n=1 Tax=Strongylus vulgaris TaxID=40348 RepID=A0A3P7LST1_STRVU|nr:unnamed protein product [Strongylus vulgaris]
MSREDIMQQSDIVREKILRSLWLKNAKRISIYSSANSGEIQTDKIVEELLNQGKDVFVPQVLVFLEAPANLTIKTALFQFATGSLVMKMLRVPSFQDYERMEHYRYGIRQPKQEDNWEPYEKTGELH